MALDNDTIKAIIEAHIKRAADEHPTWDKDRALYRCENWGSTDRNRGDGIGGLQEELVTESGAMYAYIDTMVAATVPTNPRVTVNAQTPEFNRVAKYRAALCNYIFRTIDPHKLLWKMATLASINPRCIMKAVWNYTTGRPDFRVIDPKAFFYDINASRFEDIMYACEVTTLTMAEFKTRVIPTKGSKGAKDKQSQYNPEIAEKIQGDKYPVWLANSEIGDEGLNKRLRDVFKWVTIYEFYDFTSPEGKYYHFVDQGGTVYPDPVYSGPRPYVFHKNPFYVHVFNDSLEDNGGMSDASIVKGPVYRKDELLTLYLRHLHASIPIPVIDESGMENPEGFIEQYRNATNPGDILRAKLHADRRLTDVLGYTTTPNISPGFGQLDQILDNEIQYRLGMPAYVRGQAGASDVATEFALIDKALNNRQGRRVKAMYDIIKFMAQATIRLYEEFMPDMATIPMRLGGTEFAKISRADIAARSVRLAKARLTTGMEPDDPIGLDYEVIPSSPVENSKQIRLQRIKDNAPMLMNNPLIVQKKLMEEVVDCLDMDSDMVQEPPPPPPMPDNGNGPPGPPGLGSITSALPGGPTRGGESPMNGQLNPIPQGALPGLSGGPGKPGN